MTPIQKAWSRSEALSTLGLRGPETFDEIRRAWKRKAFETHPDQMNGETDAFHQARAAFEWLSSYQDGTVDAMFSAAKASVAPRRPIRDVKPTEKHRALSAAERTQCLKLLESHCEPSAADHVVDTVLTNGRSVEFVVSSAMVSGCNRVAFPTGVFGKTQDCAAKLVRFNVKDSRATEVIVPDNVREKLFQGAKSVRIRFVPQTTH